MPQARSGKAPPQRHVQRCSPEYRCCQHTRLAEIVEQSVPRLSRKLPAQGVTSRRPIPPDSGITGPRAWSGTACGSEAANW